MKILSAEQIRKADSYTIENEPIESIDLMERAAEQCVAWITEQYGEFLNVKIFTGPGNNGGDGFAIARLLTIKENFVEVFSLTEPEKFSPDCLTNYKRLKRHGGVEITTLTDKTLPDLETTDIVIDAMFGSGLSRSVDGLAAKTILHINASGAFIIAIDIPSGLYCDNNSHNHSEAIIQANCTLTFQMPKLSFLFAENEKYTGKWTLLDINLLPEGIESQDSINYFADYFTINTLLKLRKNFAHKGHFGHAMLIAGSYGKMGAAVLSSRACLKSGAGLLTTHIPACGYTILQTTVPEAMASVDSSETLISHIPEIQNFSAIGIGPGIGTAAETMQAFKELLINADVPMVIDADAINLLSIDNTLLDLLKPGTIITPHPGEFDRLAGTSANGFDRHLKQMALSKKYKLILVLKGAYTSVTSPDGHCYFNSTGNPGMATAGSGDVLTGIILSLLAQGYNPLDAARTGVFIHGLAGDLASEEFSQNAIIASDIINHAGAAFKKIQTQISL